MLVGDEALEDMPDRDPLLELEPTSTSSKGRSSSSSSDRDNDRDSSVNMDADKEELPCPGLISARVLQLLHVPWVVSASGVIVIADEGSC